LKGKMDGYLIHANKDGYETSTAKIDSSFRVGSALFGNLLWSIPLPILGTVIGVLVDCFATGAAFELQDSVSVSMQKSVS